MAKNNSIEELLQSINPQERLKQIINYSNQIGVDPNVPPRRYYRSGMEMIRMANVYYDEGQLEQAYCLYLKFMTLFLEKIRQHPEFQSVPSSIKAANQAKLREILPRAEKLKQTLLELYRRDYDNYCDQVKQLEKENEERRKRNQSKKSNIKLDPIINNVPSAPSVLAESLDHVTFPSDNDLIVSPTPSIKTSDDNILPPSFDRSQKPTSNKYNSNILRQVIVPVKLMSLFESLAQSNTLKNIETCGILAGKLENNILIITDLILPKQHGNADSCNTTNEEEIFDYQDQYNLLTIGWIHTHPTQTAFLSSVDLHTHCPYQLLMPEAVAIVIAPKHKSNGFFNLTPSYGLNFIANCRNTGFHPHPTDPALFKNADHIRIDKNAHLKVVDLRGK